MYSIVGYGLREYAGLALRIYKGGCHTGSNLSNTCDILSDLKLRYSPVVGVWGQKIEVRYNLNPSLHISTIT